MSASKGPLSPPVGRRFKMGLSGNPKGRPKKGKAQSGSAFDIIVDKTLTLNQGGQPREVTLEEALQHQTYKNALAGNRAARREVLKMIEKREAYLTKRASKHQSFEIDRAGGETDPTNADEALQLLSIASLDPTRDVTLENGTPLLLEPWGVQKALNRRRGGRKLTKDDIEEIKRCTRDAERLRWPRGTET